MPRRCVELEVVTALVRDDDPLGRSRGWSAHRSLAMQVTQRDVILQDPAPLTSDLSHDGRTGVLRRRVAIAALVCLMLALIAVGILLWMFLGGYLTWNNGTIATGRR